MDENAAVVVGILLVVVVLHLSSLLVSATISAASAGQVAVAVAAGVGVAAATSRATATGKGTTSETATTPGNRSSTCNSSQVAVGIGKRLHPLYTHSWAVVTPIKSIELAATASTGCGLVRSSYFGLL